jgi:hypothetical protein
MIRNSFEKGPEGWCSYDYHASIVADGANIFVLTTWQRNGGVDDSGHIWTDHRRWSADTPEQPLSILPLIYYRNWMGDDPIDLREAEVSVYLRGDNLRLDGARCYFWVNSPGTRWHLTCHPIPVPDGRWEAEPARVRLRNDEHLWHRSWAASPQSLDAVLANAVSYGFSFVGFLSEVSGRLSMDEFAINLATRSSG